ncbi:MAG: zinc-binding alcohol dehydrogenase [Candidatus Marinimicrobia bacterium]|nr:zinc-binding alcohol dehydrogenase [Candidatus Neomarinimicrobiota bacterium]
MTTITNIQVCFTGVQEVKLDLNKLNKQVDPDQILIRTIYTLISPGTELAMYTHSHVGFKDPDHPWAKYPFYPGYAAVGQVEIIGSAVQEFQIGDMVYYRGRHQQNTILSPQDEPVLAVPNDMPLTWAPFARMAQIANTAILVSNVTVDSYVVIIGLGIVGNLAAQLFQIAGAKVFGLDQVAFRCELARRCSITNIICDDAQNNVSAIKKVTNSLGAHVVVEATGNPALVHPSLEMAQPMGEVILLGSPRGNANVDIYNLIHRKGVSLKGAHEALFPTMAGSEGEINRKSITRQMLQYLQNEQLIVDPLISRIISPEQMNQGYKALLSQKDSVVGVLVDWSLA